MYPIGSFQFPDEYTWDLAPSDLHVPGQNLAWGPGTCQLGPVCRHGHFRELCSDEDVPRCRVGLNSELLSNQGRAHVPLEHLPVVSLASVRSAQVPVPGLLALSVQLGGWFGSPAFVKVGGRL